jgi:tetratricopeptide (TPR) repeat protein
VLLRRGEQNAAARELDGIEAAIAQRGGPPIIALARVQALRAGLLTAANRRDDALPMYDAAIDMALALEGPQSATAIDLRLNVAYTLASTRFVDRAQRYFDAAVAGLRARGGDHVTRAALESARFATTRHISYRQVTSRAAREAVAAARAELSAAGRVLPAEMAARLAFWEAQIALGAGDIEAALPLTERSVPLLLTLESALAERLSYVSHYGHFLMVAGRHEEADRWLRERLRLRVELGAAAHPYHAFDYTFVAYNLMMQSRAAEALAFLDKAPHFEPIRGEGARNPDRYNQVVQLARSDILWASGDPQHALQVFPHGILTGDPEDARAGLAVLGPVLCALGRSAEGMDALQRVMPTIDGDGYPHDVGVASMRAVAGKCVLQQGDRGRALALARQARAAFDAQPHAAPYYEAPLLKLEEALGIRERDAAGGRAGRRSKSG